MEYALIEDGTVTNIIWMHEGNAKEFPDAVPLDGRPIWIGDVYEDGVFTRDGAPVLTRMEEAGDAIVALDAAVIDLTYQNVLLELGLQGGEKDAVPSVKTRDRARRRGRPAGKD